MTALTAFLNDIRPTLPAATVMAVTRAARRTLRGFCKETKAYEFEFDDADYTLAADNLVATFTLPTDTEIYSPLVVKISDAPIRFSGTKDQAINRQGRQSCKVVFPDGLEFATEVGGEITGTLVLIPTYNANEVADDIVGRHYEVLLEGILANLYLMEGSAWFNTDLAQLHANLYAAGVEKAADEVAGRHAYHDSTTQYGGL